MEKQKGGAGGCCFDTMSFGEKSTSTHWAGQMAAVVIIIIYDTLRNSKINSSQKVINNFNNLYWLFADIYVVILVESDFFIFPVTCYFRGSK